MLNRDVLRLTTIDVIFQPVASYTPILPRLRRGRILMGVYFAHPDGAQPAIQGQTTVAGIVDLLAKRIAQVPASVVNGG